MTCRRGQTCLRYAQGVLGRRRGPRARVAQRVWVAQAVQVAQAVRRVQVLAGTVTRMAPGIPMARVIPMLLGVRTARVTPTLPSTRTVLGTRAPRRLRIVPGIQAAPDLVIRTAPEAVTQRVPELATRTGPEAVTQRVLDVATRNARQGRPDQAVTPARPRRLARPAVAVLAVAVLAVAPHGAATPRRPAATRLSRVAPGRPVTPTRGIRNLGFRNTGFQKWRSVPGVRARFRVALPAARPAG